ncbi:ClpP/crotonase-like domain-containing protein [Exophiala viscosa]|uniref:ClpP/crotonase-like domain-containing protein n=1 Tax=Exophiala viscosa TaxID=2486360 RepID=A0AAN6DTH2_9EURO|nr:ClpP/crotonase-like domain-containing protein [Exophiala viscosa]
MDEQYQYITVERRGSDGIYVITLRKAPENRLNVACCQELIRAYHNIQRCLGSDSEGAVILRGDNAKFFCTGLDLDERERNSFASSDGFYPLLATILDFPFPTIALITGHVFGGACLLTLAHDYRVMNANRGFWQMPPVNAGLHHDGMGTLVRSKLAPKVARKVLLEAHKFTGITALDDGIVDAVAHPDKMFDVALEIAETWKSKAKMGVYGLLRNELWGQALSAYRQNSYVHHKETAKEPKVKL